MSDTTPVRSLPFNPLHDDAPQGLEMPAAGEGEFVLLLADPGLESSAWAPRTARALARSWARNGHRVLLVDGHLDEPVLQADLKHPAGEGLSDVVLWGASVDRVTRPVDSEPFRFIPAGTVVPEADRVWNHPRWPFLVSDLREMGTVTLLFAPGAESGVRALSRIADRTFWLGDPRSADMDRGPTSLAIHPDSMAAAPVPDDMDPLSDVAGPGEFELEPQAPEAEPTTTSDPEVEPAEGLTDPEQGSLADKPEVARNAARQEASARVRRSTTPPRPGSSRKGGGKNRMGLLLGILLVIVIVAIAGHAFGWFQIPGLPEVSPPS